MNESAGLQIDMLKPHVRAILDEARRVGPEACYAALDKTEASFTETARTMAFHGPPADCGAEHVLAAVAWDIYKDQEGQEGAIIAFLDALIARQAASTCDADAAAEAIAGDDG
jgi:hypothetical protein